MLEKYGKNFWFFLVVILNSTLSGMDAPRMDITPMMRQQLKTLLQSELNGNSLDISRKSNFKLKQIIDSASAVLDNELERRSLRESLKITNERLITALQSIIIRARNALIVEPDAITPPAQSVPVAPIIVPSIVAEPEVVIAEEPVMEPIARPGAPPIQRNSVPVSFPAQSGEKIIEDEPKSESTSKSKMIAAPTISLWEAADNGDSAAVDWYINQGANLNVTSPGGETALALAASKGNAEIVSRLIQAGADLNKRNLNGHSALLFAIFRNNLGIVQQLIAAGAQLDNKDHHGWTPLMNAARGQSEEIVKALIDAGADTTILDSNGASARDCATNKNIRKLLSDLPARADYLARSVPFERFITRNNQLVPSLSIWQAAAQGDLETILWYMDHGANINAVDENGELPAKLAMEYNHKKVLQTLLINGAQISTQGKPVSRKKMGDRIDSIWKAAANGDIKTFNEHIKNGVSPNVIDENAQTPLIAAASNGQENIVQKLLRLKALVNEKDSKGNTALMVAIENRHKNIVRLLLNAGATVTIKNNDGDSPLSLAVTRGLKDAVQDLIAAGADVNVRTQDDYTPLMIAAYLDRADLITILVAGGADINAADDDKVTPLMVAASRGRNFESVVAAIIAQGAQVDAEDILGRTALDYAKKNLSNEDVIMLLTILERSLEPEEIELNTEIPAPFRAPFQFAAPDNDKQQPTVSVPPTLASPSVKEPEPRPETKITEPNAITETIAPVLEVSAAETPLPKKIKIIVKKPQQPISSYPVKPAAIFKPAPQEAPILKPIPATKPAAVAKTGKGNTPLIKVVKIGDTNKVAKLLKTKIDVNAANNEGVTALAMAARWGKVDIVRMLIKAGANINTAEATGITPLQSAVMGGHLEIARLLLDNGANVNARDTYRGRTPLNWVVRMTVGAPKKIAAQIPMERSQELLRLLLSRGADPSIGDKKHTVPLTLARALKLWPLVRILEKPNAPLASNREKGEIKFLMFA